MSMRCEINRNECAFSLVELSIVLVILGLLVGSLVSSKSLIRAAQLRAISTEYDNYRTATQAFRDKYLGLPGDITNASKFWGASSNCANNFCMPEDYKRDPVVNPGTCDITTSTGSSVGKGDGNGLIEGSGNYGTSEISQFWKQLQYAGLISGKFYSGRGFCGWGDAGSNTSFVPGVNVPKSRIPNSGWSVFTAVGNDNNSYRAAGSSLNAAGAIFYGNAFMFGNESFKWFPGGAVITPAEAWSVDTKLDDGMPGKGFVIVRSAQTCTDGYTANTDLSRPYKMADDSNISCSLYFLNSI